MKVYITDTRRDTRILVIDGRHIILPSKKEVLRDISTSAFRSLSTLPFIKLRVYEESKQVEQPKVETEIQAESAPVEELVVAKNETVEQEPSTSVIVEKEETSTEEPEKESTEEGDSIDGTTPVVEETPVKENQTEDNPQSEPVDYSKLTKKELKEMAEARGCDTTGMVKADLVQWLTENA